MVRLRNLFFAMPVVQGGDLEGALGITFPIIHVSCGKENWERPTLISAIMAMWWKLKKMATYALMAFRHLMNSQLAQALNLALNRQSQTSPLSKLNLLARMKIQVWEGKISSNYFISKVFLFAFALLITICIITQRLSLYMANMTEQKSKDIMSSWTMLASIVQCFRVYLTSMQIFLLPYGLLNNNGPFSIFFCNSLILCSFKGG